MRLSQVDVGRDAKGFPVYSYHRKKVSDVIWEEWLTSPTKLLKTVSYSASWMKVFGQTDRWIDDVSAICANRAQIIQLPKALDETKKLTARVGSFCLDPSIEGFSEVGFSAAKAGSRWADFFTGLFSVLQNPMVALCKTIKSGLSSIVDLKNIYKNVVELGALEESEIVTTSKQVELGKNTVAFAFHSFSFASRVLYCVAISPIVTLLLGTLDLIMVVVNKVFQAEVKNEKQYKGFLELQSLALQRSSL